MSAKQKVTLYISDDLHRQVKIRSAIDGEPMSSIAQRAIEFYLAHSDVVEQTSDRKGGTHRVYACPKCATPVVLREDGLSLVQSSADKQFEAMAVDLESLPGLVSDSGSAGEGELIACQ
ncbi:MAG: hypothetical protein DCF25_11030 [Leptolyngbya foveolarum]|uniref:Uncharacterized protein n=1 Tax=Leptolyngbya foveolarum TaxID=47253 RepID=A0A2W4W5U6_9CYAN|nr:MAG: hypothetical protein DCF25_11030 [Leptolyngbya foveolarum]